MLVSNTNCFKGNVVNLGQLSESKLTHRDSYWVINRRNTNVTEYNCNTNCLTSPWTLWGSKSAEEQVLMSSFSVFLTDSYLERLWVLFCDSGSKTAWIPFIIDVWGLFKQIGPIIIIIILLLKFWEWVFKRGKVVWHFENVEGLVGNC